MLLVDASDVLPEHNNHTKDDGRESESCPRERLYMPLKCLANCLSASVM
jgi:hypothetical protein